MKKIDVYHSFRSFTQKNGDISQLSTELIAETPLQISINGQNHTLIMFTPQMAEELATGFVFTEGLINDVQQIAECEISQSHQDYDEEIIEAKMSIPGYAAPAGEFVGRRISFSSCGICGTENFRNLKKGLCRVKSRQRFSMETLYNVSNDLNSFQPLHSKTGGAHAAALFDPEGKCVVHSEDMGRHNALDKAIGTMLLKGISPHDKIAVSSGRASLEMILKVARAGFPLFLTMSRPTSRAVEAARFYNITLVDMAKKTNRIYTHARRIKEFNA